MIRNILTLIFSVVLLSNCIPHAAVKTCTARFESENLDKNSPAFSHCIEQEALKMNAIKSQFQLAEKICKNEASTIYPVKELEIIECYDDNNNFVQSFRSIKEFVDFGKDITCTKKSYVKTDALPHEDENYEKRQHYIKNCLKQRGWNEIPDFVHLY